MISTPTRPWLTSLALASALAALVAPAARAGHQPVRPDDRAGIRGAQPAVPDALDRYLGNRHAQSVRPDDRSGVRGAGAYVVSDALANQQPQSVRPDDRAGVRGNFQAAPAPSTRLQAATDAFHWGDAAIGAGSALAAMLLAAGIATLIVRGNRARLAAF